eukprot:scaffold167_cov110-Cylindrotheca_fusiformis.AAC.27
MTDAAAFSFKLSLLSFIRLCIGQQAESVTMSSEAIAAMAANVLPLGDEHARLFYVVILTQTREDSSSKMKYIRLPNAKTDDSVSFDPAKIT